MLTHATLLLLTLLDPLPDAQPDVGPVKSGKYWVEWAGKNAKNSRSLDDLAEPFQTDAKAFIKALTDAGAKVTVRSTRRDVKRAYLFHWSWLIALDKAKSAEATPMTGVDIQWDHGDDARSKAAAREMVSGFGLAVPPNSTVAPSLTSNHITGKAVDMDIAWAGDLNVKTKDGTDVRVPFMDNPNQNTKLHSVGETYGVKKLKTDAPHWSANGR